MECTVCYEEGVTQGHDCTTCNRITCCSKCFSEMPRKFCPLCRTPVVYQVKPGDFSFIPDSDFMRPAVQVTYESAMRHGIFDMGPDVWESALFNATELDGVGHSGTSWAYGRRHIKKMRDIGSWAGYVQWFQQER
jgi:hypothetical protein